jgi:hypothetical protein
MYSSLEYQEIPDAVFAMLCPLLAIMFIYCGYKPTVDRVNQP